MVRMVVAGVVRTGVQRWVLCGVRRMAESGVLARVRKVVDKGV
jgi:hypothetical protein